MIRYSLKKFVMEDIIYENNLLLRFISYTISLAKNNITKNYHKLPHVSNLHENSLVVSFISYTVLFPKQIIKL